MAIAVFISHSGRDEEMAAALARLLEQALRLPRSAIRCTSVPGYKLPAGVELHDILRADVAGAPAFIGLFTPASLKSDYVLFETGARWGAGSPVLPLLAGGCSATDLPKPLAGVISKQASDTGDVKQLLQEVGRQAKRRLGPAAEYDPELEKLVTLGGRQRGAPGRAREDSRHLSRCGHQARHLRHLGASRAGGAAGKPSRGAPPRSNRPRHGAGLRTRRRPAKTGSPCWCPAFAGGILPRPSAAADLGRAAETRHRLAHEKVVSLGD